MVKDFNTTSLKTKIPPCLIQQLPNGSYTQLMVKIDQKQKVVAIQTIQKIYKGLFQFYPFYYIFLDDEVAAQYKGDERWKPIEASSAVLSILISCLGLFGSDCIINRTMHVKK